MVVIHILLSISVPNQKADLRCCPPFPRSLPFPTLIPAFLPRLTRAPCLPRPEQRCLLVSGGAAYEGREPEAPCREGGRGGTFRDHLGYRENGYVPNGRPEMTPLTELPSTDSLTDTSHDIQTWLEDSSRYAHQ